MVVAALTHFMSKEIAHANQSIEAKGGYSTPSKRQDN
jgi:hypothetical protein